MGQRGDGIGSIGEHGVEACVLLRSDLRFVIVLLYPDDAPFKIAA